MSVVEPIAIVGRGCVLPDAFDPEALWDIFASGRVVIDDGSDRDWRATVAHRLSAPTGAGHVPDTVWNRRGSYVRDFARVWRPGDYAVDGATLSGLDRLFQWSIHAGAAALREAGGATTEEAARAAVILGNIAQPTYGFVDWSAQVAGLASPGAPEVSAWNRYFGGLTAITAARALGLKPDRSFLLDAACASGLVAIKHACDQLRAGEIDLALAGGMNAADALQQHVVFCAWNAASRAGHSRPFARAADGLIPAEGGAVLALRRLEDARRRGDRILGLIRGIGTSNDGRAKSLLAPAQDGQVRAIAAGWSQAGIDPALLTFAECHATGTPLGDGQEIRSCKAAWPTARNVAISSHKANFGHLMTAAGAVGVLKVLGAIEHEMLPPTPGATPLIAELESGPFRVPTAVEPWEVREGRRLATVSAFGLGGNNAHLVVEAWKGSPEARSTKRPRSSPAAASAREVDAGLELAVVAVAVRTHRAENTAAFVEQLFAREAPRGPTVAGLAMTIAECAFPPKDLQRTTGGQLLMMATAQEAIGRVADLPRAATTVFVGGSPESRLGRSSVRLRWEDFGLGAEARDALHPPLDFAATIGALPNLPANRINSAADLRGAGHVVFAEELSGETALALAARSLALGECDAAVVGAVDFGREEVQRAAEEAVLADEVVEPADAAVALVVKRAADARASGERVLAWLRPGDAEADEAVLIMPNEPGRRWLAGWMGHAHAASGLLQVAAAVLMAERRCWMPQPGEPPQLLLPAGDRTDFVVRTTSFAGTRTAWSVRAGAATTLTLPGVRGRPRVRRFAAGTLADLIVAIEQGRETDAMPGPWRAGWVENGGDTNRWRAEALAALRGAENRAGGRTPGGVVWRSAPLEGKVAWVLTGAAAAYPRNGESLLLAWPGLVAHAAAVVPDQRQWFADGFGHDAAKHRLPYTQCAGSGYLIHLHGMFAQQVLGLRPDIVFGMSSGETNAVSVLGIWAPNPPFIAGDQVEALYFKELGGDFAAVRRFWKLPADAPVVWENWVVRAGAAEVRAALAGEERCFLAIIAAPRECVIGGDGEACARVLARLGGQAVPLGHDLVVHCPVTAAWEPEWRALHTRPCAAAPDGVALYSNYLDAAYDPTEERVAEALTGQALTTIDFPRMIERVYADGARVFLEFGPRAGCTSAIKATLGDRPHLAVALDQAGKDGAEQAALAALELWCAGVAVADAAWGCEQIESARPSGEDAPKMTFDLWLPPLPVRPPAGELTAPGGPAPRVLPAAPRLAPARSAYSLFMAPVKTAPTSAHPVLDWHAGLSHAHAVNVAHQQAAWDVFARFTQAAQMQLGAGTAPVVELPGAEPRREPVPEQTSVETTPPVAEPAEPIPLPPPGKPTVMPGEPAAVSLNRRGCELLGDGRQADALGEVFAFMDEHPVQVRLPRSPYLFCDWLGEIRGEALSLGAGSLVTEYTIRPGEWYLHCGRMLMGPYWETLQADLTLIAWLGIDRLNRGRRRYRLLGGDFTLHGPLPHPGETLRAEIACEGVKRQGELNLFYFHDRMTVDGKVRVTVERGVASFFTNEELGDSAGVVWDPAKATYTPNATVSAPGPAATRRTRFSAAQVAAFSKGDAVTCFGPEQFATAAHFRTPAIPRGRMRMFDEVLELDFAGGPAGRGYAKARLGLTPEHWTFDCHFKDDPCFPGTMMLEGAMQFLSFYLAALGATPLRDGWRFEPVWPQSYGFLCRAQVTPQHREMTYELFVDEVNLDATQPYVFAHLIFHADGKPALLMERFSARLVPDWPGNAAHALIDTCDREVPPVARIGDFPCDQASLLQFAVGQPSKILGPYFARCDTLFRGNPRIPSPPFMFLSRVLSVTGDVGVTQPGMCCELAYDIAPDMWYFGDYGQGTMPFSVLTEAVLQPTGWLMLYKCPLDSDVELKVRNLDGIFTLHRQVTPADRTLRTTVRLLTNSNFGGAILQKFAIVMRAGDEVVAECETVFGFFPDSALAAQVGLPTTPEETARLRAPTEFAVDLTGEPAAYYGGGLRLARGRLKLLDEITGFWPEGGAKGLGYVRAKRRVAPDDWVFRAHFFRDPVQPGSIGNETMTQLFNWYLLHTGRGEGFASPVFEPLIAGEVVEWHFRGQVTQDAGEIEVDAEIHEEGRDEHGYFVRGEARLWVKGKKIYHLAKVGVRIVEGAPVARRLAAYDVHSRLPLTQPSGVLDVPAILGWWRQRLGGGGLIAEMTGALLARFVRRVVVEDPHDLAAWRGRPVIFLANHQVGVETLLFSMLAAALGETPVASIAKRELAGGWPDYMTGLFGADFQAEPPVEVLYFDREQPESLSRMLSAYVASLSTRPRSLMLHVEGTRATQANQTVVRVSSVFIDLAIKAGLAIVPVRFSGGLPCAEGDRKHEYPVGAGAQDYHIGRAIRPETLAALPFAERPKRVMAAINALGPADGAESPVCGDEELDARITRYVSERGWREFPAMVLAVLEDWAKDESIASAEIGPLVAATKLLLKGNEVAADAPVAAVELAAFVRG